MDVLSAAFRASQPPRMPTCGGSGVCARCATPGDELTATRSVVSKVFTAYDGWYDPAGSGLCPSCAWGYTTPELRRSPHLITVIPQLEPLSPSRLRTVLSAPVPADAAVVVPLHPGRKHLLPAAQWGQVTVDDACLTWSATDAHRLEVMCQLRAMGFGPKMLLAPGPNWSVLRRLPSRSRATARELWPVLDPWRRSRLWFALATTAAAIS